MFIKEQLAQILQTQNQSFREKATGIARDQLNAIVHQVGFASVITGVRRCGKSTVLLQILQQSKTNVQFVNFEDIRLSGFEINDFNRLLEIFEDQKTETILLDEIQLIPNWEGMVRTCLDSNLNVYVTGSNASMLSSELGTKLTGRHLSTELFPFSYSEFLRFKKQENSRQTLAEYMQDGGFPDFLKTQNGQILRQLLDDVIVRDITVRYGVRDITALRQLCVYLISNIGKPVAATKLKGMFGINAISTILEYFSHFEKSYLLQFLPKFSYSLKAQIRNPKKVYCIDLGLFSHTSIVFTEEMGRRLENTIYLHLRRSTKEIYYFQESKKCDFVVFKNGVVDSVVQVCYQIDDFNKEREFQGLEAAMRFFKLKTGYILTMDQRDQFENSEGKVEILPAWEYMKS